MVGEVAHQYGKYPVQLGANARNGTGRFFVPTPGTSRPDGEEPIGFPKNDADLANYCCAIFQLLFDNLPGTIAAPALLLQSQVDFWLGTADPVFKDTCNCKDKSTQGEGATTRDPIAELLLPKPGADAQNVGSSAVSKAIAQAKSNAS